MSEDRWRILSEKGFDIRIMEQLKLIRSDSRPRCVVLSNHLVVKSSWIHFLSLSHGVTVVARNLGEYLCAARVHAFRFYARLRTEGLFGLLHLFRAWVEISHLNPDLDFKICWETGRAPVDSERFRERFLREVDRDVFVAQS